MAIGTATIGHGRTWAKLGLKYFEKITGQSRRWCEEALLALLNDDSPLIRRHKVPGGYEYAIAARPEGDLSGIAKCRNCGTTGEVDLDGEFIPVLHSFVLSLLPACTPSQALVVTAIMARTVRAGKGGEIDVHPDEILIEEFIRDTGKGRSEIFEALAEVEEFGFIGSEKIGRTTLYWVKPENFAKVAARAARQVKQPKRERIKIEIAKAENPPQQVAPKQIIRPLEFITQPCGVCRSCHHYGPVDVVEAPAKKPLDRARAGPEGQPRSSFPVWEGLDKLKRG